MQRFFLLPSTRVREAVLYDSLFFINRRLGWLSFYKALNALFSWRCNTSQPPISFQSLLAQKGEPILYNSVINYSFSADRLRRTCYKISTKQLSRHPSFQDSVENAETNAIKSSYSFKIVKATGKKGKAIFQLQSNEDKIIAKRITDILKKFIGNNLPGRENYSKQLHTYLSNEYKTIQVIRTDIHHFFESVPFDDVLKKLQEQGFNNTRALICLRKIGDSLKNMGVSYLPRGLSFSPILAEFWLLDFDRTIRKHPACNFYCRYVDDIIVITSKEFSDFSSFLDDELQKIHLSKNPKKTTTFSCSNPKSIEFLGYEYVLQNSPCGGDSALINVSKTRIAKEKRKIIQTIKDFSHNHDFGLLTQRLQFLTTNTKIHSNRTKEIMANGFLFTYPMVKEPQMRSTLKKLDLFLKKLLFSSTFALTQQIKPLFSKKQKNILHKFSYENGYAKKIVLNKSEKDIGEINKIWKFI